MKIFLDWMHRKLRPTGIKYSQVLQKKGQEVEEMAEMVAEEKEALLLHNMLGGILTIGTLGQYRDPFFPSPAFDDEEEEEALIVAIRDEKVEEEDKTTITLEKQEIIVEIETKLLQEELPLLKEDKEKRERARTTLADLFAADPAAREDANGDKGIKNTSNDINKSPNAKKKDKKKKAKDTTKSCTNGKNTNNNIVNNSNNNKLKKLMKRMLKKKIHPEIITSANKNDDVIKTSLLYW